MGASVRPDAQDPIAAYNAKYANASAADPIAAYHAKYGTTPAAPNGPGTGALGAVSAATQGMLGGFADEIGGGVDAATNALSDVAHGRPTHFSQDYADSRDAVRAVNKNFQAAHPIENVALQLAGSVPTMILGGAATKAAIGAVPLLADAAAAASKAAPLTARIATGAATGAGAAATYGAGNATEGNRAASAAGAAKTGALVGAALPAAGAAVGSIARGAGKLTRAVTGSGADTRALSTLNEILEQSKQTPDQFAAAAAADKAAGSPAIAADALGDPGKALIRWTTNQPSVGGSDLRSVLENRQLGQYDRILSGIKDAFGSDFANIPETQDALLAAKRANADPAYQAAYAEAPYSSPTVDAAMRVPAFRQAIAKGEDLAYNDDVVQAVKNGAEMPVRQPRIGAKAKVDPKLADANAQLAKLVTDYPGMHPDAIAHAANALGADPASLTATAGGEEGAVNGAQIPIKVLDYAKRYLDTGIRRGFDSQSTFDHATAQGTNGLLGHVLDEVDANRPAYAAARDLYHSDSRMQEMADLGKGALTMSPDELRFALKGANPSEMDVVRKTFLGAYKNKAAGVSDRNDLAKQFLANPAMRQRFAIMAPTPEADAATNALATRETKMAGSYAAATGNSTTAAQLGMKEAMNGTVSPSDAMVFPLSPHRAEIRLAAKFGTMLKNRSDVKLANTMGPMLQSQPGTPEFDALVNALKGNGTGAAPLSTPYRAALARALSATMGGQRQP